MLIRSQDKMKIAVVENCKKIRVETVNGIIEKVHVLVDDEIYATYPTEKRAIEILDCIVDIYSALENNRNDYNGYMSAVYEMPEK